jgi:membrane protease subunit (stomatin/prohibitin family)
MTLRQFIDVIEWIEPEGCVLACQFPVQDREIQNGGTLTGPRIAHGAVRE